MQAGDKEKDMEVTTINNVSNAGKYVSKEIIIVTISLIRRKHS